MPKRSFTIGSGISSETRFLATSDSLSDDDIANVYANMRAQPDVLNQVWGTKANLVVALRRRYEVLKDQAPPIEATKERSEFFADRKTEAGYLRVAIWHIESVERRIREGRIWEAVSLSYDLGELITELAIKMDWEKAALEGRALIEGRKQASRQNRRHQPDHR